MIRFYAKNSFITFAFLAFFLWRFLCMESTSKMTCIHFFVVFYDGCGFTLSLWKFFYSYFKIFFSPFPWHLICVHIDLMLIIEASNNHINKIYDIVNFHLKFYDFNDTLDMNYQIFKFMHHSLFFYFYSENVFDVLYRVWLVFYSKNEKIIYTEKWVVLWIKSRHRNSGSHKENFFEEQRQFPNKKIAFICLWGSNTWIYYF